MKLKTLNIKAFLLTAITIGFTGSCGNKGQDPDNNELQEERPTSTIGDYDREEKNERQKIGTSVELSSQVVYPESTCLQERKVELASLPDDEPILLDGQIEMDGGTELTSSNFSGIIGAKAFRRGNDLYLYIRSKSTNSGRIVFNGARFFGNSLNISESLELSFSENGAITLKTPKELISLTASSSPSRAASFTNELGNSVIEVELSAAHFDVVSSNQVFWAEPRAIKEELSAKELSDAHKIFPSFYPVEGSLETIVSCLSWVGSRTGENLQVIAFQKGGEEQRVFDHAEFKSLRYVTSALTKYLGWDSKFNPATVVLSPFETLKIKRPWAWDSGAIILDLNMLEGNSKISDSLRLMTGEYIHQLIYQHVNRYENMDSEWIKRLYTSALSHKFLTLIYGPRFVFDSKTYFFRSFLSQALDEKDQLSQKVFSMLLGEGLGLDRLRELFKELSSAEALSFEEMLRSFLDVSPSFFGEKSEEYVALIQNAIKRDLAFDTLSFKDLDRDGLFDSLEYLIGTSITNIDTDSDGWFDSTEHFKKTNPLNLSDMPSSLYIDGIDNDWFSIIPQKLQKNTYVNEQCPAVADITYYSAIYGKDSLVIFGTAKDTVLPSDDRGAYWFADVHFPEFDLKATMTAAINSSHIELKWDHDGVKYTKKILKNVATGINGIEWEIPVREFGLGWVPQNVEIEVKISTTFTSKKSDICDDTDWFAPLGI